MFLNVLFTLIDLPPCTAISIFIAVTCQPKILSNGTVTYNSDPLNGRYLLGVVAVLSCNSEYHLYGRGTGFCKFDGTFDAIGYSGCFRCNETCLIYSA